MRRDGRLPVIWILILIVLPVLAAVIALGIGRMSIPPREVLSVLWSGLTGGSAGTDLVRKTVSS